MYKTQLLDVQDTMSHRWCEGKNVTLISIVVAGELDDRRSAIEKRQAGLLNSSYSSSQRLICNCGKRQHHR